MGNNTYPIKGKHNYHLSFLDYPESSNPLIDEEYNRILRDYMMNGKGINNYTYKNYVDPVQKYRNFEGKTYIMGKGYVKDSDEAATAFINMLTPLVKEGVASRLKLIGIKDKDDLLTHTMMANMLAESGWGTKVTGDYNFFGIKEYDENKPRNFYPTPEVKNGVKGTYVEPFASYTDPAQAINAYLNLWFGERYDIGNWYKNLIKKTKGKVSAKNILEHIRSKGYFTEPLENYWNTIDGIMNGKLLPKARMEHRVKGFAQAEPGPYDPYNQEPNSLMAKRGTKLMKKRFI